MILLHTYDMLGAESEVILMAEEKQRPGRPVEYAEPRKRLTIELNNKIVKQIDKTTELRGINRTKAFTEAMEAWLERWGEWPI